LPSKFQEKELKLFHDNQKNELKKLKDEVSSVPKERRKETLKRRREEKEIEQAERVSATVVTFVVIIS
jgi:STE20-like kinase